MPDDSKNNSSSNNDFQFQLRLYEFYRDRIKHEDILANHRVTYLLMSQAFLLTIVSFTSTNKSNSTIQILQIVVPLIGFVTACIALWGINVAHEAIKTTAEQYEQLDNVLRDSCQIDCKPFLKYKPLALPCTTREKQGLVPPLRFKGRLDWAGWLLGRVFSVGLLLTWAAFIIVAVRTRYTVVETLDWLSLIKSEALLYVVIITQFVVICGLALKMKLGRSKKDRKKAHSKK